MLLFLVVYAVLIIGLGFFCFSTFFSLRHDAPFIPTGRREMAQIIKAMRLKPGEVFYDLGAGDGRLVRAAARLGAYGLGIEQSRVLVWWSRLCAVLYHSAYPLTSPAFVRGNFLTQDLRRANVIFCYLMPEAMVKLKEKFERELKPGTRVVSRAFSISGWEPLRVERFHPHAPRIFFYEMP